MERLLHKPIMVAVAVAVLACSMLVGQTVADGSLPQETTLTGTAVGRAGFAYLTGVRTFAAAVLWNRLDPIYHQYYSENALVDQTQMLPIVYMVTSLDPQFVDAYYVVSWILARRGLIDEAVDLALLGVENNPESGMLRVNYAQILWLYPEDYDNAAEQASIAMGSSMYWRDLYEQHDSYAIIRALYEDIDYQLEADAVQMEIDRIDAEIELNPPDVPEHHHDHDHHDHDHHDHDHDH